MQRDPSTPALSPTARTLAVAWLVILALLVLTGNTWNHVPTGLWLIVGAVAATLHADSARRQ